MSFILRAGQMKQSTYLLPNVGGFSSFVAAVGGNEGSGTPPPDGEENATPTEVILDSVSEARSSSMSEFYSPVSQGDDLPPPSFFQQPEVEPEVTEEERLLTAPVQSLLDTMNSASTRMNECEQQARQLDDQRHTIAADWNAKKAELIAQIGQYAIDRSRGMFEAYEEQLQLQQAVNEATALYQEAVIECEEMKAVLQTAGDNGSTEAHLGNLLELLVGVQTKRDTFEHLSQDRMSEFKLAQERCVELRKTIGLRIVERAWPWFEAFMLSKGLSEECAEKMHRLRKEMATLRAEYRDCMHELESISAKVHSIRKRSEES